MSDIVIEKLVGGKSSVRVYLLESFANAHADKIAKIAPEHDADIALIFPGDRPGYRIAQYHVPTANEQEFKDAVRRVTNNNQPQHNQL